MPGGLPMSWKTPKIVEIALGAEINSYACAEAKK
jgi:coenzyme PQQ precursor peptide PqqA